MRKKTYLKLKKKRKILRRQQRKPHDRLWASVKGYTRDKDEDKISKEFVEMCDKAHSVTRQLREMGYYDSDLKVKKITIIKVKERAS